MEIETNPLELSLDELIALNKSKFDAEEEIDRRSVITYAESKKSINGFISETPHNVNHPIKGFLTPQARKVNNRLRNTIPGFGTKPIHNRLGYFQVIPKKKHNFKSPREVAVQRVINKAKYTNWIKSQTNANNPTIIFRNHNALRKPFISPLTRNAVSKFNVMNNSPHLKGPNGSNQSTFSFRPHIMRHSIKKCLNISIQREIQGLIPEDMSFDLESLADFRPSPQGTVLSTHERFSTYF